jgi:hypothetical protein
VSLARTAVLAETPDAPWLPRGGRAEVIRAGRPAAPTALVRLLLHDGDRVFCIPREDSGRPDLPTRRTARGDSDGTATISDLAAATVGAGVPLSHLGYVRNTVVSAARGYAWPTPHAHFSVWTCARSPVIDGAWIPLASLTDRHWFPLAQDFLR